MRVGATVLLERQFSVQSYGWELIRPLGKLQTVLDSLEEYECDEIAIIRPVRANDTSEEFSNDIDLLKSINSMTPIAFGGGIRTIQHIEMLVGLPIERLIFSSAFIERNDELINRGRDLFGHQAIQCLLPLKFMDGCLSVFHSASARYIPFSELDKSYIETRANEIILVDIDSEGSLDKFQWEIHDITGFPPHKVVISGGIGHGIVKQSKPFGIASVLIENKVLHNESSILSYKNV